MQKQDTNLHELMGRVPNCKFQRQKVSFLCAGIYMDGKDIILHSYDAKQDTVCKLEKRKGKGAAIKPIINQRFDTTIRTILRDKRRRWIIVDNSGKVRVGDSKKLTELKAECSGNNRKVVRLNSKGDKMYFVSASDRSIIVECDLSSLEIKLKEIKFKYGKIIDLAIIADRYILTLNKEGKVEIKDLLRKELTRVQIAKIADIRKKLQGDPNANIIVPEYMREYESTKDDQEFDLQEGTIEKPQDGVEFTALCKVSDDKIAAIGYKFIPKKEEPIDKSKAQNKKKPEDNKVVEDPNDQEEELKDQNASQMEHEIYLFNPEQPETKQKQAFLFETKDRESFIFSLNGDFQYPEQDESFIMGITGGEAHKLFVIRCSNLEEKDREIDANGPLNDFIFDRTTSQVYITANDGCLYKVFLEKGAPDDADGDFEVMDGMDEFEDELADGNEDEGEAKQNANKAGATTGNNKAVPPKAGEGDKPKGKTDPAKNQPAPATNGGKPAAGSTSGGNNKPGATANQPTGGSQANTGANNGQQAGGMLKSKLGNKKYEDAEAEDENY